MPTHSPALVPSVLVRPVAATGIVVWHGNLWNGTTTSGRWGRSVAPELRLHVLGRIYARHLQTSAPDALMASYQKPTAWDYGLPWEVLAQAGRSVLQHHGARRSSAVGRVATAHVAGLPADCRERCHRLWREADVGVRHEHHIRPRGGYESRVGPLKGVAQHQHVPAWHASMMTLNVQTTRIALPGRQAAEANRNRLEALDLLMHALWLAALSKGRRAK